MKKLAIISIFILLWGIYPISSFYFNISEINYCQDNSKGYDLKLNLSTSVYSGLFFSLFIVYDLLKQNKNVIVGMVLSMLFIVNLISNFILFGSLIIPQSFLLECSKNITVIIAISAIFPEIITLIILILSGVFLFIFLEIVLFLLKKFVILPIIQKDISKISLLGLFIWNTLLIWSLIQFEKDTLIISLGIFQILFTFISMHFLHKRNNRVRFLLQIVTLFGVTIYFLSIYYSKYGWTVFGIISFLSICFGPFYYFIKKSKKIFKRYLENRASFHTRMPEEPPAIYASGEIEVYKKLIIYYFI